MDYLAIKRWVDVAIAAVALLMSLPIQVLVSVLIRLRMGRPVLFRQQRPGLHGEAFEMVKFRTMTTLAGPDALHSTARVTPLGRILRATSLDELPTLWNVIRGDMSLVGPRPLLMEYLSRYSAEQARRHDVRPGVTGLAQVAGRNAVGWDERLTLDVAYVDSISVRGDLAILCRTFATVCRFSGTNAATGVTMTEFRGQKRP